MRRHRFRRVRFRLLGILAHLLLVPLLLLVCVGLPVALGVLVWEPLGIVALLVGFLALAAACASYREITERYVDGPVERRDLRSVQSRRDRWVRRNSARLLLGNPPFCLYLRPFVSSGALRVVTSGHEVGLSERKRRRRPGFPSDLGVTWGDLEAVLADVLLPDLPLVALGRPGEQFGAGRWKTSDADWQDVVRRLFDVATLIFVVPSRHPATAWELAQLIACDGWRDKTVVLVPSDGSAAGLDGATSHQVLRGGAAKDPGVEVAALRADALTALLDVGAGQIANRASRIGATTLWMPDRRLRVAWAGRLRYRAGRTGRTSTSSLVREYTPSHGRGVQLDRQHLADLVAQLVDRVRTPRHPGSVEHRRSPGE